MEDEAVVQALDELARQLGAKVKMERKRPPRDWSQAALANRMRDLGHASWRQTTVAKVEAATRPVSFSEAIALAYALGLPRVHDLLGEESPVSQMLIDNFSRRTKEDALNAAETVARLIAERDPGAADRFRELLVEALNQSVTESGGDDGVDQEEA